MRSILLLVLLTVPALAAGPAPVPKRPAHTYSIVARDPETGELGVAVQSHWFSVATQSLDEAVPLLQKTYKADARWKELLKRLPKSGLLPEDPKLMNRLVGTSR